MFFLEDIKVGDLNVFLLQKKRPANVLCKESASKKQGRHVKWDTSQYTLLRKGTAFENMTQIDQLFGNDAVDEAHFFIFKRLDSNVLSRNDAVPVYEAAYLCNSFYVRVQKKHLAQAYRKCGRSKKEHMWSVDEDTGLPYWVDRHCFSMMGQRASKKRYEAKKRRK